MSKNKELTVVARAINVALAKSCMKSGELSKKIGITPDGLYKMKSREDDMYTTKRLQKLSDAFGISIDEFLELGAKPKELNSSTDTDNLDMKPYIKEKRKKSNVAIAVNVALGQRNKTNVWLAKQIGMTSGAWNSFKKRKKSKEYPIGRIKAIAKAFGLTPNGFMALSKEIKTKKDNT